LDLAIDTILLELDITEGDITTVKQEALQGKKGEEESYYNQSKSNNMDAWHLPSTSIRSIYLINNTLTIWMLGSITSALLTQSTSSAFP